MSWKKCLMGNPNNLYECQQMFRHACAFAECAEIAAERFHHESADVEWYTTPATVNSAFACEVFLKALLKYYDIGYAKKHKIKDLYEMIPEDTKAWIKRTVMKNYGGIWSDAFGQEILENVSNAFVDWRYWYEAIPHRTCSMQIDMGFLDAFRNTLREVCTQLFFGMRLEEYIR